ncbi:hypothetical protein [Edwardsiella ictaluri]|uniref:hypothetical protein n=1 Tax=Edwardsiella ictaluri TaxID=67780 RepID=UPI001E6058AE|nr:hypothetical protein [Edwardsiella ictaluri]
MAALAIGNLAQLLPYLSLKGGALRRQWQILPAGTLFGEVGIEQGAGAPQRRQSVGITRAITSLGSHSWLRPPPSAAISSGPRGES